MSANFEDEETTSKRPRNSNQSCEWIRKHDAVFQKAGLRRPSFKDLVNLCDDWSSASRTMFLSLSSRSREIVYFMEYTCDDVHEVAFDVSQTFDFCHARVGFVGVLAESSRIWLLKSRRLITGSEAFALQGGTSHHYSNLGMIDQELLSSLAGNAFNGVVCMQVMNSLIGSITT
jgi:hypothetical protein